VISGAVLSAASQVGDLIASLIKRENGVKDYGNIFPGHGGVMDRFDSVLSISTILMVISIIFPPFY
jgi:phosphatidate cytidylyltransferase